MVAGCDARKPADREAGDLVVVAMTNIVVCVDKHHRAPGKGAGILHRDHHTIGQLARRKSTTGEVIILTTAH